MKRLLIFTLTVVSLFMVLNTWAAFGMSTDWQRAGSFVQDSGRYKRLSIRLTRSLQFNAAKTPTWRLSCLPSRPLYCRATPALSRWHYHLDITRHLGHSRNAKREIEVSTIANAIYQYALDKGSYPSDITSTSTEICNENAASCVGYVDLSDLITGEEYLLKIPEDPLNQDPNGTGYYIYLSAADRIIVTATFAENGLYIDAKR